MRALIFAAGRGERMRPLTLHTPKPLLEAGGKPLIVWHLERLARVGVSDVVINVAHLAEQFPRVLGDGKRWNLRIHCSDEGPEPLETGGGMLRALPLLGDAPFVVVNGDVYCDVDFAALARQPVDLAHLVMVAPPAFAPLGDFHLDASGQLHREGAPRLTYAGVGLYHPGLLREWKTLFPEQAQAETPRFRIAPLLQHAMDAGRVSGFAHHGRWTDVGTPERLRALDESLRAEASAARQ